MMSSSTYRPDGKAHWLLEQLEFGPMARVDLMGAAEDAGINKARYVIGALITDGFVTHAFNHDQLTDSGREALETLRDGHPVFSPGAAVPSVRVFERRAA